MSSRSMGVWPDFSIRSRQARDALGAPPRRPWATPRRRMPARRCARPLNTRSRMYRDEGVARYLFLLLATACARPAAAPPPVLPARPAVALAAPEPAKTPPGLPPSATIFIGCGFLRVENHGSTTFSIVLPAAKPMQSKENPSVLLLDDVLVQAAVTSAADIGAPALRGEELLRHQMSWEADRMAQRQGWKNLPPP